MKYTLQILLLCFSLVSASKCPEARKPHVNDCSIYYECINLPEGGYVWAPAKCPEGLMFQPHLRLCVLPGDTWTCVESPTHPPNAPKPSKTPELINETKTSYHELISNSFNSHEYFNLDNLLPIIPYPLIEVWKQVKKENGKYNDQTPQKMPNIINLTERNKIEELNGLGQVIFYQNPSSTSILSTPPIIHAPNNEFFVQFIRNYIFNKTVNSKSDKRNMKNRSTTTEKIDITGDEPEVIETTDILLNDELIDEEKNVIAIRGNLATREYVTLEKYKLLATQQKIDVLEILPCTTGIRLPNSTNCMKYYTCQPKTAEVHEFTCPHNTAFNAQINLCDPQKYKSCRKNNEGVQVEKLILVQDIRDDKLREDNPCEENGKFADKTSEKFYYLCYTNEKSEKMEFVRLSCPNDLVFCDKRKVCVSKHYCYNQD